MTRSSNISTSDTAITTTSTVLMVTEDVWIIALFEMIGGNPRGFAPNTSCPEYSRKSDTPMAVMRTVSFGRDRNGRYAKNSMVAPSTAQIAIERRNTRIVLGSVPTGKKCDIQTVA